MKEQKNKHSPFSAACEGASAATNPEEGRVERQEGPGSLTLSCAMNYESADPGATPTPHLLLYKTVKLLPVGSLLLAAKSMGTDIKENKHTHGTNSVSAAFPAQCTDYDGHVPRAAETVSRPSSVSPSQLLTDLQSSLSATLLQKALVNTH